MKNPPATRVTSVSGSDIVWLLKSIPNKANVQELFREMKSYIAAHTEGPEKAQEEIQGYAVFVKENYSSINPSSYADKKPPADKLLRALISFYTAFSLITIAANVLGRDGDGDVPPGFTEHTGRERFDQSNVLFKQTVEALAAVAARGEALPAPFAEIKNERE